MLIKRITPVLLILALVLTGCTAQDSIHTTIDNLGNITGIQGPQGVPGQNGTNGQNGTSNVTFTTLPGEPDDNANLQAYHATMNATIASKGTSNITLPITEGNVTGLVQDLANLSTNASNNYTVILNNSGNIIVLQGNVSSLQASIVNLGSNLSGNYSAWTANDTYLLGLINSVNGTLPDQTGNGGKFLTTNGTDPSWAVPTAAPGNVTGNFTVSQNISAGNSIFTQVLYIAGQLIEPFTSALKSAYDGASSWVVTNGATVLSSISTLFQQDSNLAGNQTNNWSYAQNTAGNLSGNWTALTTNDTALWNRSTTLNQTIINVSGNVASNYTAWTTNDTALWSRADSINATAQHSNRTILDAVSAAFTTAYETSYNAVVTWLTVARQAYVDYIPTLNTTVNNHVGNITPHVPDQTGQAGKYLTTNGSVSSWSTAGTGNITGNGTAFADIDQALANLSGNASSNWSVISDNSGNITILLGNVTSLQNAINNLSGNASSNWTVINNNSGNISILNGNVTTLQSEIDNLSGNLSGNWTYLQNVAGNQSANWTYIFNVAGNLSGNWTYAQNTAGNLSSNYTGWTTNDTALWNRVTTVNQTTQDNAGNIATNWTYVESHATNTTAHVPDFTGQAGKVLSNNGTILQWIVNSASVAWGGITGTLSDQADLWQELQNLSGNISLKVNNTFAGIIGALGYVPANTETWTGNTTITTVGTITTGTWNGTAVADGFIASAQTWNNAAGNVTINAQDIANVAGNLSMNYTAWTDNDTGLLNRIDSVNTTAQHSNRSILDAIEESFTSTLKSAYDGVVSWLTDLRKAYVDYVPTMNTTVNNHIAATNNPHVVTAQQAGAAPTTGNSSIITVGNITSGIWSGTAILDAYIASAATWNAKVESTFSGVTTALGYIPANTTTWTGNTTITTLGTITTGIWNGTAIADLYIASATYWNGHVQSSSNPHNVTADQVGALATANVTTTPTAYLVPAANASKVIDNGWLEKTVSLKIYADNITIAAGDGKFYLTIPASVNGFNLIDAQAAVSTVSSSGTVSVMIHNYTDNQDMLSAAITIDANEKTSYTAATPSAVNTSFDDVVTGDQVGVDLDVAGTGAKGLEIILTFRKP